MLCSTGVSLHDGSSSLNLIDIEDWRAILMCDLHTFRDRESLENQRLYQKRDYVLSRPIRCWPTKAIAVYFEYYSEVYTHTHTLFFYIMRHNSRSMRKSYAIMIVICANLYPLAVARVQHSSEPSISALSARRCGIWTSRNVNTVPYEHSSASAKFVFPIFMLNEKWQTEFSPCTHHLPLCIWAVVFERQPACKIGVTIPIWKEKYFFCDHK